MNVRTDKRRLAFHELLSEPKIIHIWCNLVIVAMEEILFSKLQCLINNKSLSQSIQCTTIIPSDVCDIFIIERLFEAKL